MNSNKISIIGAGAWGTTLSILLAEKGYSVTLWIYENELIPEILELRENKKYLPGFQLPQSIEISSDIEKTTDSFLYIFAVPTQFLRQVMRQFAPLIKKESLILCASKGIEEKTLALPTEIIQKEFTSQVAVLSGPNLSKEIASGLPAASVVACENLQTAKIIQEILSSERFRIYVNSDPMGVQLGGALKNIIAIAAGVVDELNLGDNAKAALLIRGIAEITRLGVALGAEAKTFAGLSGMGDLIATCSSKLSRNHFVGEQIAKGRKLEEILANMKDVARLPAGMAEGVPTTKAAYALAKKHKIEMPITAEVYAVLFEGKDPYQAITSLMTRTAKNE